MSGRVGIGGQGAGGKGTNSVRAQPAAPKTKTAAKATVLLILEIITSSFLHAFFGFLARPLGYRRCLIGACRSLLETVGDGLQTATLTSLQLRIKAGIACAQHIDRNREGDDNASQRIQRPGLNPLHGCAPK
nr:MAG TPA: hypothetical protein [Caudoviricetes sp.]